MIYENFEQNLIASFEDSERHCTYQFDKVNNTVTNINTRILDNRDTYKEALNNLIYNPVLRTEMAKRVNENLNTYYSAKGFEFRSPRKSQLIMEHIILTLGNELSSNQDMESVTQEFVSEILTINIKKYYGYIRYESPLAACFENYN